MKSRFIEFLLEITSRPGMFLVNNVEDIQLIIFGYINALSDKDRIVINDFMIGFRDFVNKDFESTNDYDWPRLIRFHSAGNIHSIELFKKLFNEFILV